MSRTAVWRMVSVLAAAGTAIALEFGADDLGHPERHEEVAVGVLQFAHWCFVAALILMLLAAATIALMRGLAGAAVAWFVVTFAGFFFYVGAYNLAGALHPFTASGAGVAMVLGLLSWGAIGGLMALELRPVGAVPA